MIITVLLYYGGNTMIKFMIMAVMVTILFSCTPIKDEKMKKTVSFKGQNLGAKITLKKVTKMSDILKTPKSFIDKKVLVKYNFTIFYFNSHSFTRATSNNFHPTASSCTY